jgi:hypothetical protein
MAGRVGRPEIIQEAVVRAFEYLAHEIVSVRRRDEIAALGAVVADGVRGIFVSTQDALRYEPQEILHVRDRPSPAAVGTTPAFALGAYEFRDCIILEAFGAGVFVSDQLPASFALFHVKLFCPSHVVTIAHFRWATTRERIIEAITASTALNLVLRP